MKTEIENLIQLAKEFVEFALSVKQPDGFTVYGKSRVYFANFRNTQSVDFDNEKIEVILYKNTIELPFSTTDEYLKEVYESAKLELADIKAYKSEAILIENEKQKLQDIQTLENRLKELQED